MNDKKNTDPAEIAEKKPPSVIKPLAAYDELDQYRLLLGSVQDYAIYLLDDQGRVTTWNRGAQHIKGYAPDEIIGQHYSIFFGHQDQRDDLPMRALKIAAAEGHYASEGWRRRKDGTRFWASVVITPLRDNAGALLGFAKITRDFTEKLQQQHLLEETQSQLAQSQKMEAVGQLTGGIAHDFNNLLTTIIGHLDLLERRPEIAGGPGQKHVATGKRAAEQAALLTQQLLAFSRKQPLDPKPIDANRLISNISELLRRTLGADIVVETVLAGGLWTTRADPNQLQNSLLNIVINARDAMPKGGKLTIETGNTYLDDDYTLINPDVTPGQYAMLAVTDTGTGMPAEMLPRIFEPFYTTKPEDYGTGLGLSQVHGFVKQSGGHIRIYSEVGVGTTVNLYLPRYTGDTSTDYASADKAAVPAATGETVLAVDDDPDVRSYVVDALQMLGYNVVDAKDGPSALHLLEQNPGIKILVTDIGLPGVSGKSLAEEVLRRRPGMKVLYITGYAQNAIAEKGLKDPTNLLPKPFTIETLGRKLRSIVQS